MAFVFSQSRWTDIQSDETPGPGSHCPDIITSPKNKAFSQNRIRKGKTFCKLKQQQVAQSSNCPSTPSQSTPVTFIGNQRKTEKLTRTKFDEFSATMHQQRNPDFSGTKFMEISSLHRGVFLEIKAFENSKEQISMSIKDNQSDQMPFQNLELKRTAASIRPIIKQKFYIGSKDEQLKRKQSPLKSNTLNKAKRDKIKSMKQIQSSMSQQQCPKIAYDLPEKYKKKVKPISAKHPFHKNNDFYCEDSKYEQKSTQIQQQEQSQSSEYMDDALPGPGSYEIQSGAHTTKKSMMFTDCNRDRFDNKENSQKTGYEFWYTYKGASRPIKSRASQKRVGFGRGVVTEKQKNINQPEQKQKEVESIFYSDNRSIENKCIRLKIRDALNPGFFTSKASRFPDTVKSPNAAVQKVYVEQQKILGKLKKDFEHMKPTQPFISGVSREHEVIPLTSGVQYTGQDHKTIKRGNQQILSQPKYNNNFQEFDTFKEYKPKNSVGTDLAQQKKVKTDIQIKHQLIQDMYGFRQRDHKKQSPKGYTFSTSVQTSQSNNFPSPNMYYKQRDWTTNTFNTKFMQSSGGFQHRRENQTDQNEEIAVRAIRI